MAKAIVAERTVSSPTRATAALRSMTLAPPGFRAAEFAIRTSCVASTGSLPMTRTMRAASEDSSANTFCTRITMCGNPGSSTLPPESSAASACTKVKATLLSSLEELVSPGLMVADAFMCAVSNGYAPRAGRPRLRAPGWAPPSNPERLPQGVNFVLRFVDEFLVAGAVDVHALAGGDVV